MELTTFEVTSLCRVCGFRENKMVRLPVGMDENTYFNTWRCSGCGCIGRRNSRMIVTRTPSVSAVATSLSGLRASYYETRSLSRAYDTFHVPSIVGPADLHHDPDADGGGGDSELMLAINQSLISYQSHQNMGKREGLDMGQVFALPCGRWDDASVFCGVCQEPAVGDFVTRLPLCDHRFHKLCINPWLFIHNTCPICRKQVA